MVHALEAVVATAMPPIPPWLGCSVHTLSRGPQCRCHVSSLLALDMAAAAPSPFWVPHRPCSGGGVLLFGHTTTRLQPPPLWTCQSRVCGCNVPYIIYKPAPLHGAVAWWPVCCGEAALGCAHSARVVHSHHPGPLQNVPRCCCVTSACYHPTVCQQHAARQLGKEQCLHVSCGVVHVRAHP